MVTDSSLAQNAEEGPVPKRPCKDLGPWSEANDDSFFTNLRGVSFIFLGKRIVGPISIVTSGCGGSHFSFFVHTHTH